MHTLAESAVPTSCPPSPGSLAADVVRRGAYLWERAVPDAVAPGCDADAAVRGRLERWQHRLAALALPGDEALRRRLAWSDCTPAQAALMLRDDAPAAFDAPPAWAATVEAMCREAVLQPVLLDDRASEIPFRALLEPLRRLARRRLDERLHALGDAVSLQFAPACFDALEDALLRRLQGVGAAALMEAFEATLPFGERLLLRWADDASPRARYRAFVGAMLGDGFAVLFTRYPVLARLWATVIEFWVEGSARLVGHTIADAPALAATLFEREALPRVHSLGLSLSDAHRSGLSTAIFDFGDGLKAVYKPKPLGLDLAWQGLLVWCSAQGAPWPLKTLRVIDRADHGWCEHVAHAACADAAAVGRYYARTGALLALMHLVRGTDAHFENLIAHGDQPCLIDTETLLHPDAPPLDGRGRPPGPLDDSVIRTGLLPRWELSADRRHGFDVGGLATPGARAFGRVPV